MLIAIISDTHGNSATLAKFAGWAKQNSIAEIVHCGDIGFADFIKEMAGSLPKARIRLVAGNMDNDETAIKKIISENRLTNINFYGKTGQIKIAGKKIAFTHKPDEARRLARAAQFDMVFFGHTHKPWEEKIGVCRLINPGNLAGEIYPATFAAYDTKTARLELKIVANLPK